MSADGGESRKPLEKWAFRGVCPPKFPVATYPSCTTRDAKEIAKLLEMLP